MFFIYLSYSNVTWSEARPADLLILGFLPCYKHPAVWVSVYSAVGKYSLNADDSSVSLRVRAAVYRVHLLPSCIAGVSEGRNEEGRAERSLGRGGEVKNDPLTCVLTWPDKIGGADWTELFTLGRPARPLCDAGQGHSADRASVGVVDTGTSSARGGWFSPPVTTEIRLLKAELVPAELSFNYHFICLFLHGCQKLMMKQ